MRHHGFGTGVSRGWDAQKIGAAISGPGVDTRCWLSLGIVATVKDVSASEITNPLDVIDDTDQSAIIIGAEGVEVDVVLLPSMDPITCRVPSGGAKTTVDAPISPGDEVLVAIPNGLPGKGGVIVDVMNSAADRLPLGDDDKPLFKNDRYLIWADEIPIDLRTGPVRILMKPDTNEILFGTDEAVEQLVFGTSYRADEDLMFSALKIWLDATTDAINGNPLTPPPLKIAVTAARTLVDQLLDQITGRADHYLSAITKTK